MSNRAAVSLSTRTIKIYSSAYDAQARAEIDEHVDNIANPHGVTAAQVGLGNADNTADLNKPISTAQAAALALKAPLLSPALTGTPTAPTAVLGTVSLQIASTAFVQAAVNALDIPDVTGDLAAHLADHANPHVVTKSHVGLALVDNTADLAKPVSGPQQTAINVATAAATAAQADIDGHQANTSNPHGVTKGQVGLGAVDNTADAAKPVSGPQQTAINAAAAIGTAAQTDLNAHKVNTANPHGTTKAQVGLGAVDNTADLAKPVSPAQQAAINAAAGTAAGNLAAHTGNTANPHGTTKAQVGLGSVDNTSDLAKPISTATAAALALKAALASPALSGVPTAPTAAPGTSTLQIASTAFAGAAVASLQPSIAAAAAAAAAAQADADEALALIAAGSAGGASHPGDAPSLFGQTKTGPASAVVPIPPEWVVTSAAGRVVRIDLATVADPPAKTVSDVDVETIHTLDGSPVTTTGRSVFTTIAPAGPVAIEAGRLYQIRWKVQRQSNPVDPFNDAVRLGIAWLNGAKGGIHETVVEDVALVVADGIVERSIAVAFDDVRADIAAPAGSVYFRPFIDAFGDWHVTDIIALGVGDVSSWIGAAPLYLPLLDADPVVAPGAGLLALYGLRNPVGGSASLRMQVGTDPAAMDIILNVGSGG